MTSFLVLLLTLSGCAISHPCYDGGDVELTGVRIKGDMRCKQEEFNGKWKNHGPFTQKYVNGNMALEGEFKEGLKEGIWLYYSEDGSLKEIKYFERGVDRPPPPEMKTKIDAIIEEKTTEKAAKEKLHREEVLKRR